MSRRLLLAGAVVLTVSVASIIAGSVGGNDAANTWALPLLVLGPLGLFTGAALLALGSRARRIHSRARP